MARKQVFSGSIDRIDVLDTENPQEEAPELSQDDLEFLYKKMMMARKFDEKAFSLQRRGEISTYAPHKGQEAAQVGSAFCLLEDDWLVPSFRETAAFIAREAPLDRLFQRWMGDANGQKDMENAMPVAIPVGTQTLHGAGIGMAMAHRDEDNAAITYFGDGATSEGDFHEALNFSGVRGAHTVFFCQNNQYAISLPREKQTKSETIAQKALAYGMDGIQVDGNDVLAVVKAVGEAMEKARNGEPVLVEAVTYRLADHTTSDDSTRYRDEDEVEEWKQHDPIKRFTEYLKDNNHWNDELENFEEEAKNIVQEASEKAIEMEDPSFDEMFDYVYKEMPEELKRQKQDFKKALDIGGDQ
ncbi:MAG: pyruvate dehydrogenase (acetyl-transferring) E1 component subunit alpha [Candidatus Nanohaloarchaea archaeon]